MSSQITITKTINICETLKTCGSNHQFSNIKVALIFRTLLLIDSLHDFTDMERTNSTLQETIDLTLKLYQSYKRDLNNLIRDHSKLSDNEKTFLSGLLANNTKIPIVNKIENVNNHTDNKLTSMSPSVKLDKILSRLCFHDETVANLSVSNKNTYGIINKNIKYNNDDGITIKNKNDKLYTLKKFIGSIKLNNSTNHDYSDDKPIYILCEATKPIKENNTNNEYIDVIEIISIFFDITKIITTHSKTKNISPSKLHEFLKKLMDSLKFELKSQVNFESNNDKDATPWGFIHNIICSKINNNNKPPCDTNNNRNFYPDITLSIDSEKTHGSKKYLIDQLQNFYETNTESVDNTKKKIKAIEDLNINIKHQIETNKDKDKQFNYILENSIMSINPEKPNFTLVRTAGTNFDAAPKGNLSASIIRLDGSFNIVDHLSPTYIYDINLVAGNIELIHLKYEPDLSYNTTKLQLLNWFNDSSLDSPNGITHTATNSSGFTLKNAIEKYDNDKNLLNLHFKTLTDTGQVFCFHAIQSYDTGKVGKENTVYIFHTNDTFCGAIASLILPGTVIERSDQLKQDSKNNDDEFHASLYSGANNVYCARGIGTDKGTYDIAKNNICKFQTISNTTAISIELIDTLLKNLEKSKQNLEKSKKKNVTDKELYRTSLEYRQKLKRQTDNKCQVGFVSRCVPDINYYPPDANKSRKRSINSSNNSSKRARNGGKKGKKTLKKKVGKKTLKKKVGKKT
jgi:hypothetical protein